MEYLHVLVLIAVAHRSHTNKCDFDKRCTCQHGNGTLAVYCEHKNLTELPYLPVETTTVLLQNNQIRYIQKSAFISLVNMEYMDLSWNHLTVFTLGTFDSLKNLETLKLKGNRLAYNSSAFPDGIFKSLTSLKHFDISHSQSIFHIPNLFPTEPMTSLRALEHLTIDVVASNSVSYEFQKMYRLLNSLSKLDVGYCQIMHLTNETFSNVPYLKHLNISHCNIQTVGKDPFIQLKALDTLDASYNYMYSADFSHVFFFSGFHTVRVLILRKAFIDIDAYWLFSPYFFYFLNHTGIRELYLQENEIAAVRKDFTKTHSLPYTLEIADFSDNKIFAFHLSMMNLSNLILRNNTLIGPYLHLNRYTDSNCTNLKHVDLSNNGIRYLKYEIFKGHGHVIQINLSYNNLDDITFDLSDLKRIKLLDVSNNNIRAISRATTRDAIVTFRQTNGLLINLSNNNIQCNCLTLPFLQWMIDNSDVFDGFGNYTCTYTNGTRKQLLRLPRIVELIQKQCASYLTVIVCTCLGIILTFLIIFIALVFRYRWRLRFLYYMTKRKYRSQTQNENHNYIYDVFLSYSNQDDDFVQAHCLPNLEEKGNLRLCIHQRDFLPGMEITQNISDSIRNSQVTVCVISKSFFESYFCMFELNMARMESVYAREGKNILLLVLYEQLRPAEMPLTVLEIIQKRSYIEYPNDEQGNVVFWEKLIAAIKNNSLEIF